MKNGSYLVVHFLFIVMLAQGMHILAVLFVLLHEVICGFEIY